jgi:hypothetical protein
MAGCEEGSSVGFETATIDRVIGDAHALHAWFLSEIKKKEFSPLDPDSVTAALKSAASACGGKFANLINTYPFFSRDMATTGFIDDKTLRQYFHWVSANPWQSDAERLTVQAKYYFFKTLAVHGGPKHDAETAAQKAFEATRNELLKDDARLKKVVSDAQAGYAARSRRAKEELVEEIKAMMQNLAAI